MVAFGPVQMPAQHPGIPAGEASGRGGLLKWGIPEGCRRPGAAGAKCMVESVGDAGVEALLRVLRRRTCGDSMRYLDLGRNRTCEAGDVAIGEWLTAAASPPASPLEGGVGHGSRLDFTGPRRGRHGGGSAQSSTATAGGYSSTAPEDKTGRNQTVGGSLGSVVAVPVPTRGSRSRSALAADADVGEAIEAGLQSKRNVCTSTGRECLPLAPVHSCAASGVSVWDTETWAGRAVQWRAGGSQMPQAEDECAADSRQQPDFVAHLVSPFHGCQGRAGPYAAAVNPDTHSVNPGLHGPLTASSGKGARVSAIERAEALASRARAVLESRRMASPIRISGRFYFRPLDVRQNPSPQEAQHRGTDLRTAPPRERVQPKTDWLGLQAREPTGGASRAVQQPRMDPELLQPPPQPQPLPRPQLPFKPQPPLQSPPQPQPQTQPQ
jgi:hypothetical protein